MNAPIKPGAACAILAATLAFSLIFAANAFAQEVEAERVIVTGEPVTVTGSLIPTTEEVGPNPVSTLNRDLINKSGQGTTTEQLLKSLPIASANSIPVQNNATAAGGPPGAASISLRGFDPGATLVLIDGRRVAPYPGTAPSGRRFLRSEYYSHCRCPGHRNSEGRRFNHLRGGRSCRRGEPQALQRLPWRPGDPLLWQHAR